jgi:hypothetical protein
VRLPGAGADADSLSETLARLTAGDPETASAEAAALRRAMRLDPGLLRTALARLRDPSLPEEQRTALALILGTIASAEVDPGLLAALADPAAGQELRRALLLALGATRDTAEDDEVFGLGDNPWGQHGPAGLGITIRREIADAAVLEALSAHLGVDDPGLRRVAATSLRHSLGAGNARDSFRNRLAIEPEDGVAAILGEALVGHARRVEDPVERDRIVEEVLARASTPAFDALRFRIEDDLSGMPLPESARTTLAAMAEPASPFGERAFAFTVLARSAAAGDATAVARTRTLLRSALAADRAAPVRDLSARLLRHLPPDPADRPVLVKAAREDPAWNVRYTALETLAKVAPTEARPVLESAREDRDPRVADLAESLLAR